MPNAQHKANARGCLAFVEVDLLEKGPFLAHWNMQLAARQMHALNCRSIHFSSWNEERSDVATHRSQVPMVKEIARFARNDKVGWFIR